VHAPRQATAVNPDVILDLLPDSDRKSKITDRKLPFRSRGDKRSGPVNDSRV
jgi:hypothetical protein